jgi:hypothetical protein
MVSALRLPLVERTLGACLPKICQITRYSLDACACGVCEIAVLAAIIHEVVRGDMMGGDEAVGLA